MELLEDLNINSLEKFSDFYYNGIRHTYSEFFRDYQQWLTGQHNAFITTAPKDAQHKFSLCKFMDSKKDQDIAYTNKKIYWVTITPPHDIDINAFIERIHDIIKMTCFQSACYTFEQTGTEDNLGYHPHVHIVADKIVGVSPQQLHNRIYRSLKQFLGTNAIRVQTFPYEYRQDKIEYLKGNKWDDEKDPAIEATLKWRAELGLKNFYSPIGYIR